MSYKSIYSGDEIDSAVEYFKKNFKNLNIVTVSNMYKTIEEIPLFDSSGDEANEKFITTDNAYYGLLQITIGEDSPNTPLDEGLERRTVLMLQSLNFNGGTAYATNEYKVQQILFGYKSSVYIRNITESFTESWKEVDILATADNLATHTNNKNNPHGVTKAQLGLSKVNNTSDEDKPISALTQKALDEKADKTTVDTAIEKVSGGLNVLTNELSNKANKASLEVVRDKAEGIEKDVSTLDTSLKTVSDAFLNHDSNENIHVTPDERAKWNDADKKFSLIENGIIEVKETVVGNLNDILVYDKNGNATTDIEDIHTGTFKLFVKYEDENPDVIFILPDGYLLMEQRIVTFDGMRGNEIVQTILMNNQLYTRVTDDLNFLVGEFGEFAAIDLTPVDTLESDDANAPLSANMGKKLNEKKEDSSNKSDVIDDSADDTKYPTTKAVKDYVSDSIEELRGDIHAEILTDGNDQVLYIMNNRFKLFD